MVAPRTRYASLLDKSILGALADECPQRMERLAESLSPCDPGNLIRALLNLQEKGVIHMTVEGECSLPTESAGSP